MNALRLIPLFAFSLPCITASAQWIPFESGLSSVRNITTDATAIYAVSFPQGIYKSTNDGADWTPCNTGLPMSGGNIFAQSVGRAGNYLFAGTESGVYRSDNGGASWTNVNDALTANSNVYANKWFKFGNTVFAVFTGAIQNGGGIARTTNNGNDWLIGHSGMGSNQTVYHMAEHGGNLLAATNTGMYISTDNGQQWSQVPGSNFGMYTVQSINGRLVCIYAAGFKYSTTNGASWTEIETSAGVPDLCSKGELIAYDGKLFAITGDNALGVIRSVNNGTNWSLYTSGLGAFDQIAQEKFHASGNWLYIGALQDLYRVGGSTVGLEESAEDILPLPYPTLFTDAFTVDLSSRPAGSTVVVMDALGREVARHANLPSARVLIQRGSLAAGRYQCMVLDPSTGAARPLGAVVAQ